MLPLPSSLTASSATSTSSPMAASSSVPPISVSGAPPTTTSGSNGQGVDLSQQAAAMANVRVKQKYYTYYIYIFWKEIREIDVSLPVNSRNFREIISSIQEKTNFTKLL